MKILVAIANHGTKNKHFLDRLLTAYRGMRKYDVDIVILSNLPKDLGPDVEVIVGAPTKNPWSLPFGYKTIFAERVDQYDLFIYSEDDTLIEEKHVDAFLAATELLPQDCIAGFMRYEIGPDGTKYYSTLHGHFHWDPHSVLRAGGEVFAHYTNEHSACFIITRDQLKKGLANGGFLKGPRIGRYDMLCTAATDPYTQCGMKKLICISRFDDFCLHHLPNIYCGRIGMDAEFADREIVALSTLDGTSEAKGPLFPTSTGLEDCRWDKRYYAPPDQSIIALVPAGARRVLSVGCGCGSTEEQLIRAGLDVTGVPLNCVIGAMAAARGVKTLPPDFDAARDALLESKFDVILLIDVLHRLPDPVAILRMLREILVEDGWIILSVPNFTHLAMLARRSLPLKPSLPFWGKDVFGKVRMHYSNPRKLRSWLEQAGFEVTERHLRVESRYRWLERLSHGKLNANLAKQILVCARPSHKSGTATTLATPSVRE